MGDPFVRVRLMSHRDSSAQISKVPRDGKTCSAYFCNMGLVGEKKGLKGDLCQARRNRHLHAV